MNFSPKACRGWSSDWFREDLGGIPRLVQEDLGLIDACEVPSDQENRASRRSHVPVAEGTCRVKATPARPKIVVTGGRRGVVGHAGARLLADLADATGLTSMFSQGLAGLRQRQGGHDPGRIAVDLAVMLADGGEAIADLAVLRDQRGLFGPVASDPTAWRLLAGLDESMLAQFRTARAAAREIARAQHSETRGALPAPAVAGQQVPGLVLDVDASIVLCHSEKESATSTWKKTFGYHPVRREALLIRAGVRDRRYRLCRSRAVKLRTA
jgi:Transposase DDE domain group 1